jgi:hypothetical protein
MNSFSSKPIILFSPICERIGVLGLRGEKLRELQNEIAVRCHNAEG